MSKAIEALQGENYINLETFKKDGNGVKTPVWFAESNGKIVVFADNTSFKVKRLGRNPKARIAACDMRGKVHGDWFEATAHLSTPGSDEANQGYEILKKKYGFQWALITMGAKISGSFKRRQVIIVEPA